MDIALTASIAPNEVTVFAAWPLRWTLEARLPLMWMQTQMITFASDANYALSERPVHQWTLRSFVPRPRIAVGFQRLSPMHSCKIVWISWPLDSETLQRQTDRMQHTSR